MTPPSRKISDLTHRALKEDLSLATQVGRKLFPAAEAEIIAELIRRDLPYYDPTISENFRSDASRAQGRPLAGDAGGPKTLSGGRGRDHRRADPPRPAVL